MTDKTTNKDEATTAADEKSFGSTPKTISKGTLIMLAATALFILVAGILFLKFLNAPAGGSGSNSNNSESRAKP